MEEQNRDERSEKASKEFDIPSPYEDYSNMLKNFNSDSDLMRNFSSPLAPDLVQNLNFNTDHAVDKHPVGSQQGILDQNASGNRGVLMKYLPFF